MSPAASPGPRAPVVRLRIPSRRRSIGVPSWLTSMLLHSATLAVALMLSRAGGCQFRAGSLSGSPHGDYDLVASLVTGESGGGGSGADNERSKGFELGTRTGSTESTSLEGAETGTLPLDGLDLPSASRPREVVPDRPPVALQLPGMGPSMPTMALAGPSGRTMGIDQLLSPVRSGSPQGGAGGGGNGGGDRGRGGSGTGGGLGEGQGTGEGPGGTSMFGIRDKGERLVYVIDTSASMADYNALQVAKAELMASLEDLTEMQQFQVLFCNSSHVVRLNSGRAEMFRGTDIQRADVARQMSSIDPDSGTDHKRALMTALGFKPDVIFYLTDAGEPQLLPRELEDIRQGNRTGARIHCIHFGKSPALAADSGSPAISFMQKLAVQNHGQYTYRDVRQFARR